ncbi:hypothetical protein EJ05DRAFT_519745 [Pseudovirgaria hyperparasitica]|uniref:DNA ligase D 3'-phosphoesterase domain-containing protein n=1 Tax=Pseudovirgaria hyperparasitica TaxID=470096 RepID=A0A6A6VWK8_9PEZI|nr:uncharacterized protein EJ05DRAFT_519745 [Pseudovirgaria hyperparasitica]KAF2755068.1 hypothetical protein EJ05DRAFT_519745 [Pseudovirgaria hyperparasitica]
MSDLDLLSSLKRSISPPTTTRLTKRSRRSALILTPAAVEAGSATIGNHLEYFCARLTPLCRPPTALSIDDYGALFKRNQHEHGRHFVVHQHSHPVAGVHYDLRLQVSATSSVSWAVPYGLPGDPNSKRLNRMAIETRVHCVWNHLIESASHATGSLLIWDTGEYEVLPRHAAPVATDDDDDDDDDSPSPNPSCPSETTKLRAAFRDRHIRLRLHGTRLPANYTIYMRLPSANAAPHTHTHKTPNPLATRRRRRRRKNAPSTTARLRSPVSTSEEESETRDATAAAAAPSRVTDSESMKNDDAAVAAAAAANASDVEDAQIATSNAYPGATNDIGSVHQRRWFLGLDRGNSGFVRAGSRGESWVREDDKRGFEPFYVRGSAVERSVVTGRLASELLSDEGVEGFVERGNWQGITS